MTLYTFNDIPHPHGTQNVNLDFESLSFQPHSAVMDGTISGKSRNTNIVDLCLFNILDSLETDNIPSTS